ncbi:RNA methyltransferase [Amycolatopsis mediterranei]|uniref:TrmH family RNA methyltransferase n=1 Tax=Amycolatopsis mediterranei TaxID=33910 RepID=UPI00341AD85B
MHDAISAQWERLRSRQDVVVLEGFHAIKHALRFGGVVDAVVTTDTAALRKLAQELAPDVEDALTAHAQTVSAAEIAQLLGRVHQTEVAALARRPAWPEAARPANRPSPAVLLENPRNLGNIGAVIRVAAGLGLSSVYSTGTVDPWHPTVIRGSAGLHYALPVRRLAGIHEAEGPIYSLDPAGIDLREAVIPQDALLAFGSERSGISPELRRHSDVLLSIPMRAEVSSYNLTTSVAMAAYHWVLGSRRQL